MNTEDEAKRLKKNSPVLKNVPLKTIQDRLHEMHYAPGVMGGSQINLNSYDPNQPREPKGSETGGQWTKAGGSETKSITRIEKTFKGTHLSSNIESLKDGFKERKLGISIARSVDEEMSSPTLDEPKGIRGRVYVEVTGKGLDYKNPKHRDFIDTVITGVEPPYDVNAIKYFRSVGVDWIDNWGGIGQAKELHVLNPKSIKILRIEKF